MTITEVGCMGVKPNIDIMDEATPEGKILKTAWETVLTKPGGPKRVFWGLEMQDPLKIWAFFDWDSKEQHEAFARTHGAEAVKDIPRICTHGEFTKHVAIVPSSTVLTSPLTEIILAYFPADISMADKDERASQLLQILRDGFEDSAGIQGLGHGWGSQNDFPVRGSDGQTGSVLMGFVSWPSVNAQESFARTSAYTQILERVKGMDGGIGFFTFTMASRSLERPVDLA